MTIVITTMLHECENYKTIVTKKKKKRICSLDNRVVSVWLVIIEVFRVPDGPGRAKSFHSLCAFEPLRFTDTRNVPRILSHRFSPLFFHHAHPADSNLRYFFLCPTPEHARTEILYRAVCSSREPESSSDGFQFRIIFLIIRTLFTDYFQTFAPNFFNIQCVCALDFHNSLNISSPLRF